MQKVSRTSTPDPVLLIGALILLTVGSIVIRSISPDLFPLHLTFILISLVVFFIFLRIDFDVLTLFSNHLYVVSVFLLTLPLIIGEVTRGAIRWIPLGPLTIQPSEIVRPFLLLFFANYLIKKRPEPRNLITLLLLLILPTFLIFIQPSLGVALLTLIGFFGVLISSPIKKRYLLIGLVIFFAFMPLAWSILAPYQKQRITSFIDPSSDPQGAGYNSIQAMISVGSGRIFGRGLGKGVQTQLEFLPEKHTDFIFAATAEELGFVGSAFILIGLFVILWRLTVILENAKSPIARAYVTGFSLGFFAETLIHIGMNVGLLPITGIPLPLVSAGGSSLLATMMALSIAVSARKPERT